jgi:lipoic acid synthetase
MSGRLPSWFKQRPPDLHAMSTMATLLNRSHLRTICESAQCPNSGECFSQNTATFLVLGDVCTRQCTFCAVAKGTPAPVDEAEPDRLLEAAMALGLRYAVITSVTRDDLADGGASHFARVVSLLTRGPQAIAVEVLVPDFRDSLEALKSVVDARPKVINHNIETVPRLYTEVKPGADYRRSLALLSSVKHLDASIATKSGLMVGLGETREEVITVMKDLRATGCDLLTIGQYLQPTPRHHPIDRFVTPQEFADFEEAGKLIGFTGIAAAPLVRSSYHAAEMYAMTMR